MQWKINFWEKKCDFFQYFFLIFNLIYLIVVSFL